MIDETVGKYKIIEYLGRGGMADVYKAYQPGLDRHVAVKVLHPFLAAESNFLARFRQEAKAVAALRHPNIVQVYDFDHEKGRGVYYMVMELITGPTLKVRLGELAAGGEHAPLGEAIRIAIAVGEALDYAHHRGMVHRDVKPANIMFTMDGEVVLADFGIARMINVKGLTASGAMVGTPAYIAPEQGLGQAGDERSDIYSLGVVLYQLVTGSLPFDAETPMGIVLKHINDPLPSVRALRPDAPEELEWVINRALAKDPAQRYQTAAAFVADLRRVVAGQEIEPTPAAATSTPALDQTIPTGVTPPPGLITPPSWLTPPPPAAPHPRSRWLPIVVGALAVLVLAALGLLASSGRLNSLMDRLGFLPPDEGAPTPEVALTHIASTMAAFQATMGAPTPEPLAIPPADLTATAVAGCDYGVELVEDVPVRPSVVGPGQAFTKRWVVRNSGDCAWRTDFQLVPVSGDELGGPETVPVDPVGSGGEWEVELELTAPRTVGAFRAVWQFEDGGGVLLGDGLPVEIWVGSVRTPLPLTVTPTPPISGTATEALWMSEPQLIRCNRSRSGGRMAWTVGGGPSEEYHYFYGSLVPGQELEGPSNDFMGFPHTMTYFTVSGQPVWPVPEDCCVGDYGRYVSGSGYEVIWMKVQRLETHCP